MPSVGMRRSTRVFGARVLRSGRRLWPDSSDVKLRRLLDRDDWYRLMKNANGNGHNKTGGGATGCKSYGSAPEKVSPKELKNNLHDDEEDDGCYWKKRKVAKVEVGYGGHNLDRMFGVMYNRKRKRLDRRTCNLSGKLEDKLYGLQYSRRRRRKSDDSDCFPVLAIVIDGSICLSGNFEHALCLVFGYLRTTRLGKSQLAEFLRQLITSLYPYQGLRILPDAPANTKGVCKFFGARQFTPLFSVDFAAVPLCFMYMHRALLGRMMLRSFVFLHKSLSFLSNGELLIIESEEPQLMEETETYDENVVSQACFSSEKDMLHPSVRASKLAGRSSQYRNGQNTRSFRKRRSSFRRRRAKNLSLGVQKPKGALFSTLVTSRKKDIPFSFAASRNKPGISPQENSSSKINEMSSAMMELNQDMDSLCCSANILVIESDRCGREAGASVMLELSSSREWFLVVKKDGSLRYSHKAQNLMKPCACNRLTHAIMWTGDDNWKLEFCNRQDWSIFKELYKECCNRNVSAPNVKVIPVPGVSEVFGYEDDKGVNFLRPVSYISVNGDEISRAMAKSTAIYDMDSEDEEWLKKFNNQPFSEDESCEYLSENNFELMIDGFEKDLFVGLEDYSAEKAASSLGHLGRREVVEAVCRYWMRKRKQKKTPLLRIFQGNHVKKAPVVPKPFLRKRRSFKRQGSQQFGRGKQTSLLQAVAAGHYALEEYVATVRVDEAKAAASRSLEAAIVKRQRAQILMEKADLATYKAVMALRIAEAAHVVESSEAAASHFLD